MADGFDIEGPMILVILAAWLYFELMRRIDAHWANKNRLTDEERLWNHARNQKISEHEIFKRAAAGWSLDPQVADTDFKDYLKSGDLPHYVRDYLRKLKTL